MLVVSVGGSLLSQDYFPRLASVLSRMKKPLVVTVGGGEIARRYMPLIKNKYLRDRVGIKATELHALVLHALTPGSLLHASLDFDLSPRVHILPGLFPGITTDGVAALAAERFSASLVVNLTNVEGVYDRDPRDPGARLIREMTMGEFRDLVRGAEPGRHMPFDSFGVEILARSGIPLLVCSGKDPEILLRIEKGEKPGTYVY